MVWWTSAKQFYSEHPTQVGNGNKLSRYKLFLSTVGNSDRIKLHREQLKQQQSTEPNIQNTLNNYGRYTEAAAPAATTTTR
jgi:hypothetical protein